MFWKGGGGEAGSAKIVPHSFPPDLKCHVSQIALFQFKDSILGHCF